MTLPTLLGLLVVKLTIIAYTIVIGALFILSEFPVHPVVITTTLNHTQINDVTVKWDEHDKGGTCDGEVRFFSVMGTHKLWCKLPHYEPQERDVLVRVIGKTREIVNFTSEELLAGGLFVSSSPSGADIWIDTQDAQRKTPNSLYNLPVGEHILELKKGEYYKMTYVMIEENKTCTTNLQLETPPVTTGTIKLKDAFAQVQIYIDGHEHRISQTPAIIDNIPVGSHWIELRRPHETEKNYEWRWKSNIVIGKNKTKEIEIGSDWELIGPMTN